MIDRNANIVILTGAGISKESGLATFRDADGIWATVRIEDVATPDAYRRNPERVHAFYNARRQGLVGDNIRPNRAHDALARLEREWTGDVLIVTQNIDDLHERAGSENLIHMHGELLKARCDACGNVVPWRDDLSLGDTCAACATIGRMRPHVVWFGEMPFDLERIERAMYEASLFVSIGTSGNVYPAAGYVSLARQLGIETVELNLEPSEGATLFQKKIYGPASEIVPAFVERLLDGN